MGVYLLFVVAFSANAILYKFAGLAGIRAIDITTCAFLFSGLLLSPALYRSWHIPTGSRARFAVSMTVVTFIGGSLGFWALAEGIHRSGAARGGLFLMTVPVMTAIIDLLFGARYRLETLISGVMTIVGGIVLAAPGFSSGARGDIYLLVMVLSFSSANVASKFVMRTLPAISVASLRALVGGLGLLAFSGNPFAAGGYGVTSAIFSAIFLPAIYTLIQRKGPAEASLANIYASLLAMLGGIVLLGERLTLVQWSGAAIIVAVSLVEGRRRLGRFSGQTP